MQTKELTKGALLAALTALFSLSYIYLPVVSFFGMFAGVCAAAILLTCMDSMKVSVISLAVSLILTAMFSDIQTMLFSCFLMIVFPGFSIGMCLRKKKSFSAVIMVGSIAYFLAIAGTFLLAKQLYGIDLVSEFRSVMEQTIQELVSVSESVPELAHENEAEKLVSILPELAETMTMMIPSVLLLASAFLSFCSTLLIRAVLRRIMPSFSYLPSFSQLHVPKMFAYGYLGLTVAEMLLSQNRSLYFLCYNVSTVLSGILFIGGISLIKSVINKIKLPDGISLLIFCLIVPFMFFFFQLISLVGLIDAFWDFRKPKILQ